MIPVYKPYLPAGSLKYAHEALDSTWLSSQGKYLQMVQEKLQELLNVKYVLPVNNGTSATHLVAKTLYCKISGHCVPYDIVVPNNVYVAAWNSFLFDFQEYSLHTIDANLDTWNFDKDELFDALVWNKNVKAVLIVHNIGNIINVPKLKQKYPNIIFVEDACEGFLGKYEGKYVGTESFASSISFFGNKNITSGEGGAFITNDQGAYEYAKCIHGQGQSEKRFIHKELGYNYRMTNIQAAILYGQLEILNDIMKMKNDIFSKYRNHIFGRDDIFIQSIEDGTEHSNWMFGVRVSDSNGYELAEKYFKDNDIEIRPMFYPISAHKHLNNMVNVTVGDCTNAEILNKECFILPSYPELTDDEIKHILKTLDSYVKECK